jgi:protein-tyrosine phosphatase
MLPLSPLRAGTTGSWLTTHRIVGYSLAMGVIVAAGDYYWFFVRQRERAILGETRQSAAQHHSPSPLALPDTQRQGRPDLPTRVAVPSAVQNSSAGQGGVGGLPATAQLQGGGPSREPSPQPPSGSTAPRPEVTTTEKQTEALQQAPTPKRLPYVDPAWKELPMSEAEENERQVAVRPGLWVPRSVREELDYGQYEFTLRGSGDNADIGSAPSWLCFDQLEACARGAKHGDYIPGSGKPHGAEGGGPALLYAAKTCVHGYAARIEVAEILGTALPGAFLAMPGPADLSSERDAHPFMKVLKDEKVRLLCRLVEGLPYENEEFWTKHLKRPEELTFPFNWSVHTFPTDRSFLRFVCDFEAVADACFAKGQGVAVHCGGGVGRTGTLIVAYLIKKQVNSGMHPDPWGVILELRKRRRRIVADVSQLAGLYRFAKLLLATKGSQQEGSSTGVSPLLLLAEQSSQYDWVSLTRREALDYEKHTFTFKYEEEEFLERREQRLSAPAWLKFECLENCSRSFRYEEYLPNSGKPTGAISGHAEELPFTQQACVHGYAAKIEVAQILGSPHRGRFLAMPGPADLDVQGDAHPFMRVLKDENVGLLCRLTSDEFPYFKQPFWLGCSKEFAELSFPGPGWPSYFFPQDDLFEQFVRDFEVKADACFAEGKGVAIHCLGGVGRTGTLIVAYLIKKQVDGGKLPDPWGVILELRQLRCGFVDNRYQLAGLYRFAKGLLKQRSNQSS